MLVLSRKKDQQVRILDFGINIRMLGVKGSTVRLGIEAPDDIRVLRGELVGEFTIDHDLGDNEATLFDLRHDGTFSLA